METISFSPIHFTPFHDFLQEKRGEQDLVRSGIYLGSEILKVIAAQTAAMPNPVLHHEQMHLPVPMREWDPWADLSEFRGSMLDFFEQSRADWPRLLREKNPVETRLHVLRLGAVAICFNPAEPYVELGLAIKQRSSALVTLIGELSDGTLAMCRHQRLSATVGAVQPQPAKPALCPKPDG
jgi:hypothetical protein